MFNLINAYSQELYIGEKRTGKTLCMVADTYEDLLRTKIKIPIFCNFHLKSKFFENLKITREDVSFITKEDLIEFHKNKIEFHKCIFLIDEFQNILDNREFMEKGNKSIIYFLAQMGKRGNVLRATIHDYNLIDIKGRLYSDKLTYIFKGLIDEQNNWFPILNANEELTTEEQEKLTIQKKTYIKKLIPSNFLPEFHFILLPVQYIKAKKYFNMYDTEEMI